MTKLFKNEKAQGLVEYGLLIALISIVAIGAISKLGNNTNGIFNKVKDTLGEGSVIEDDVGVVDEDDVFKHGFTL